MAKIENEKTILAATKQAPRRDKESEQAYRGRIARAVNKLPDDAFAALPMTCQLWYNDAAKAVGDGKPLPDFEEPEELPTEAPGVGSGSEPVQEELNTAELGKVEPPAEPEPEPKPAESEPKVLDTIPIPELGGTLTVSVVPEPPATLKRRGRPPKAADPNAPIRLTRPRMHVMKAFRARIIDTPNPVKAEVVAKFRESGAVITDASINVVWANTLETLELLRERNRLG